MDFLTKVVGPLTVLQWIGVFVAVTVVFPALGRLFGKKEQHDDKLTPARCLGCGWQGKVSKYHRTCPKCGNQITKLSKKEG